MNKYSILFLLVIFFQLLSCKNKNTIKNDITADTMASKLSIKRADSTTLNFTDHKSDPVKANSDTQLILNESNLKTDDYIKQFPANQKAELRRHIAWLRKEWQNVPNPITATYQGNDFGDYHHILFKASNGVEYDFGQGKNNYGQYKLFELSKQYNDNPEFSGKEFKIYWGWKLAEFLCCEGEYGKAKAYLPSIIKLELINK